MANLVLPGKYADAIFLIAKEKNILEQIKEELKKLKDIINNTPKLKDIIFHPVISKDEKKKIILNLFSRYMSEFVINFLQLLIDKKREKLLNDIIDIYSEKVDEYKGIKKVTVETAYPLDDFEKDKLLKQLKKIMKAEIVLQTLTKEDMLGGIIVRDKLHLIDASVNQFLNTMKQKLSETRVESFIEKEKIKKEKVNNVDKKSKIKKIKEIKKIKKTKKIKKSKRK